MLANSRAYFAQQLDLIRQQAPGQQPPDSEVAVALPTNANAVSNTSRYFN
jgi:hypothetical protein